MLCYFHMGEDKLDPRGTGFKSDALQTRRETRIKKHQDIKMQLTYINVKYFVNAWCEHKANIQKLYCENPRSNYPNFYQQKICCSLAASGHIHKSYGCFVFLSDINPFGLCAIKSKLYLKRYRKKNTKDHFQLVSVHLPSDGIRS